MEYIQSSELINEVKNQLSTWFDSNKLDESILYRRIRYCLSKMKLETHPRKIEIIEVNNYKGKLPEDFQYLCMALACIENAAYKNSVDARFDNTVYLREEKICEVNLCESTCNVVHDNCGNMFKITQEFKRKPIKYTWYDFEPLKICNKSRPKCVHDCFNFNIRGDNEIEIKDKEIITTFCDGLIYIEYFALLEEKGEYLIPDNETIKEWIIADMVKQCFLTLLYNSEPNVQVHLQLAQQDLHIKETNARALYKRFEKADYYKLANTLIKRYNRDSDWIWREGKLTRKFKQ